MIIEYLKINSSIQNITISIVCILVVMAIAKIAKSKVKKVQVTANIDQSRYLLIKKQITFFSIVIIAVTLIFVWGINLKQVLLTLGGVMAMIAIAFFALWSILGNILACVILYFTAPFKLNEHIEIIPDEIYGKVISINTFYTVLIDEEKNYICVPNTMFFQKYIKNYKHKNRKITKNGQLQKEVK